MNSDLKRAHILVGENKAINYQNNTLKRLYARWLQS